MPKFWLLLLLIFFLIRYVLPPVLRLLLGSFVRRQVRNSGFGPMPGDAPRPGSPPAPGQVRVDFVPPATAQNRPKPGFQGGEYVDFEEVK